MLHFVPRRFIRTGVRLPDVAARFSLAAMVALVGCGLHINTPPIPASTSPVSEPTTSTVTSLSIQGHVGGQTVGKQQWSVAASSVQLYAAGTQGTASSATPLLAQPIITDANGNFTIPGTYTCPASSSMLYMVATGGNPGLGAGINNSAIALMTMLGPCSALSSSTFYPINEVTTVGSVWPLTAAFDMASAEQLGFSADGASSSSAVWTWINQLINPIAASSPGVGVPAGYAVQSAKLNTLASDFHACVASPGGTAGDGSACGQLFSLTTMPGGAAPADTLTAALQLAQLNLLAPQGLFQLAASSAAYQPVLSDVPADWDLNLVPIPAAPVFSPESGNYLSGQAVTLTTTTPAASIHYTIDGSQPTADSSLYVGPLTLMGSQAVRAVAVTEAISSLVSSADYSIALTSPTPAPPTRLVFTAAPVSAVQNIPFSPVPVVRITDTFGNLVVTSTAAVTLTSSGGSPLSGTTTGKAVAGIAAFPGLSLSSGGSYTLVATSPGLHTAISAPFFVNLAPTPPAPTPPSPTPPAPTPTITVLQNTAPFITAAPGSNFQLTYNWTATTPTSTSDSVTVAFTDSKGNVAFHDDHQPPTPTTAWSGAITYTRTVTVPTNLAPGTYTIFSGLLSSSGNVPLIPGAGVKSSAGNLYQTGTLNVAPTCSITSFGAISDSTTDNAAAIQATFAYAAAHACIAFVPAGTFSYSGTLTASGIAVAGGGASSILAPTDPTNEALVLTGPAVSLSNLAMISTATSRLTTPSSGMVLFYNAASYYAQNLLINNSSSTGIMSYGSHDGYILHNTVENTLADSITQIEGSYGIVVSGNRILASGDDGISNNSYVGDPAVYNVTVDSNSVLGNLWGRGIEVSGGSGITFTNNYVNNPDGFSDVYIASEKEWHTGGVNNVTVQGNVLIDGGPNQGSVIIYNSQGSAYTISGVTVTGNTFYLPPYVAIQYAGNGPENLIVVDGNLDYSTSTYFSASENILSEYSQSLNSILTPLAAGAPAPPSARGCTFSGC